MSDRTVVINQPTGAEDYHVQMFMDGESGTWRLFLNGEVIDRHEIMGRELLSRLHIGNVDFSLDGLKKFHAALTTVLAEIEQNPNANNAEVRAQRRL